MKNKFRIVSIIVAVAIVISAVGLTVYAKTIYQQDGYDYSPLTESTVSVCGWDNRDTSLRIPKTLGELYVGEIDDNAFKDNTVITSVDFGSAVQLERIGVYAFYGCTGLSGEVVIAGKIKTVDTSAFENCTSIENVSFYSARLSNITAQCFCGCTSLTTVQLPYSLNTIDKYAFADCPSLSYVMIPNSVNYINPTAFYNCPNLVIYCYTGSYAQSFAIDNGYDYVLLDAPAPTEPPTEPDTQEPTHQTVEVTFILGDADGDVFITILDATKVQRVLADLDDDTDGMITLRSAVDGDVLNIMHATAIQRYLAAFEVSEPIGETVTRTVTA